MTVGITDTEADAVLKQRYPAGQIAYLGYKGRPLLAMIPKMEDFTGNVIKLPVHWGGHTGTSAGFSTAQANQAIGKYDAFLLTRAQHYGLASIQMHAYEAAKAEGPGAFLNLLVSETDGMFNQLSAKLSRSLYRNKGGAKGQVGSTSAMVLTLLNVADIVNFEVGDKIVSDDTDGSSGGAADAEVATITAVDRELGTISRSDANWTTGGNFANNDYLFNEGDFGLSISGLDGWLPETAPGATAFFNVDRSADTWRLGGGRFDASAYSIEEGLQLAESRLTREGGNPDYVFMNNADYADLRTSLGSRVIYDRVQSSVANISFSAIVLDSSGGAVRIMADRDCPVGKAYMLTLSDWKLYSLGKAPRFVEHPAGLGSSLIVYNDDAVEYRGVYRAQVGCRAPGHSLVITLPSA